MSRHPSRPLPPGTIPSWQAELIFVAIVWLTSHTIGTLYAVLRGYPLDRDYLMALGVSLVVLIVLIVGANFIVAVGAWAFMCVRHLRLHRDKEKAEQRHVEAFNSCDENLDVHLHWSEASWMFEALWFIFLGFMRAPARFIAGPRWWPVPRIKYVKGYGSQVLDESDVPEGWLVQDGMGVLCKRTEKGWTAANFESFTADFNLLLQPVRLMGPAQDKQEAR